MSSRSVEYTNIGLMAVSFAAAMLLPFELFLFSYAILGPLHYLTEISWLHERRYFTAGRYDAVILTVLGALVVLGSLGWSALPFRTLTDWVNELVFVAFGAALVFVLFPSGGKRLAGIAALIAIALLFRAFNTAHWEANGAQSWHYMIFTVYLPTLVHVYVFTGAFILYGALKRGDLAGYVSLLVFVALPVLCLLLPVGAGYAPSASAAQNYGDFRGINQWIIRDFFGGQISPREVYSDPLSVAITRFIAFAYTYHYLNWFSKTSLIQWHRVPRGRLAVIAVAWVSSVVLYAIDYRLGLQWLLFLSITHVFLEFPLNHRSFIGIGAEFARKARWSRHPAA